jgi:DNA-binding MarR family transcriptional regulator
MTIRPKEPAVQKPNFKPGSAPFETANRLHSTAIHLLRLLRMRDKASGVGPARLSALSVLVFAGPKSLKDLSAMEQVKPPTITRIVAGLERSGLARRHVDKHDGRSSVVTATALGQKVLHEARIRRVEFLAERLASLSPEQLLLLQTADDQLRNALKSPK